MEESNVNFVLTWKLGEELSWLSRGFLRCFRSCMFRGVAFAGAVFASERLAAADCPSECTLSRELRGGALSRHFRDALL